MDLFSCAFGMVLAFGHTSDKSALKVIHSFIHSSSNIFLFFSNIILVIKINHNLVNVFFTGIADIPDPL